MSTWEYDKMYREVQKNKGKYQMIVFDTVNSRKCPILDMEQFHTSIRKFTELKYNTKVTIYVQGDAVGFCVERSEMEKVYQSIYSYIYKCNPNLNFHIAKGYCDTLNWAEGNKLYYAGYLFDKLSKQHKEGKRCK